jgi:aminodeoxyfutalosine deaminase
MTKSSNAEFSLTGRWLFPIDGPPLANGVLTIALGRIHAVEPRGTRTADIDLGDVAILPGFVNAHTHLDLSGSRGLTPPTPDFVAWLRQVIARRRVEPPEVVAANIRNGLHECLDAGTTLIGDIAAGGQSWDILTSAPCRSIVYYELLGLSKVRAHQSWSAAVDWLRTRGRLQNCRPGLSPHAPYSVRASLFRAALALAAAQRLPIASHLGESLAEAELIEGRKGPMVAFLQDLGVFDPGGLIPSVSELIALLRTNRHHLVVHGNYLEPGAPIGQGINLVYCPRTHHAFGHTPYPLSTFLQAGARIALGTDSLASNPDLSLFREAQFVYAHQPEVAPEKILEMATLNGAVALGWDAECATLTPGKWADLAVVKLGGSETADPAAAVLDSRSEVCGTMIAGNWYKDPRTRTNASSSQSGT